MNKPTSLSDMPRGFSFSSTHCGLKKRKLDLAILVSETPAHAAAVFTTNRVQAAPVQISRAHIQKSASAIRAVIVNSGNANCCTGPEGFAASRKTAAETAKQLKCAPENILVCSTGVIGAPLKVQNILSALPALVASRDAAAESFEEFSRAIMTTDTLPKRAAAKFKIRGKEVRILGTTKGAGMIEPNMATMLAFIATDAAIATRLLDRALRAVVARTFNAITVDGDTSTNDTVTLLANGQSGARAITKIGSDFKNFCGALEKVCRSLATAIVADGEGAQRVIEVNVTGASSARAADKIARTIANSPLVKTALAGADPNWGRILAAAGRSGIAFDPTRVDISLAGVEVCRRGREKKFNERTTHEKMLVKYVPIVVNLHAGPHKAHVWTCDFTTEYVHINASYRT
jgi:glutamate N-acetyltransferase/amino-acid N-acetyltransferase